MSDDPARAWVVIGVTALFDFLSTFHNFMKFVKRFIKSIIWLITQPKFIIAYSISLSFVTIPF